MELFISLHTASPGKTLEHEVSYAGYQRVELPGHLCDWEERPSGDLWTRAVFPAQTDWISVKITHGAISDQNGRTLFVLSPQPAIITPGPGSQVIIDIELDDEAQSILTKPDVSILNDIRDVARSS